MRGMEDADVERRRRHVPPNAGGCTPGEYARICETIFLVVRFWDVI